MKPDVIIVRLGELTLKGRNRHRFERKIMDQLRTLLSGYGEVDMKLEFGRIHVTLNQIPYEAAANSLNALFGITSYSPAIRADVNLEAIRETAVELMKEKKPGTFKAVVKRSNKSFPYDSQEMAYLVGGYVLEHVEGWKVDVHHPEVELRLDIRDKDAFVFTDTIKGPGGYPIGTNGKAMLLLSGGIDSPVAGWLSMRRGLEIEAVHFHSYPYTSERAKQKVIDLAKLLTRYSGSITLHLVPFTDIQVKLKEDGRENLLVISMKRAMLRIAEQLAEKRGAQAIITGESLGQVASQTLPSIDVIGRVASLPVLRPLIMYDKADIIRIAEEIGTYPVSIQPYEDCCTLFLPKSPSTNPNLQAVERSEAGMTWLDEEINKAALGKETMKIRWDEPDKTDVYF